jgi:hypothetical protein
MSALNVSRFSCLVPRFSERKVVGRVGHAPKLRDARRLTQRLD